MHAVAPSIVTRKGRRWQDLLCTFGGAGATNYGQLNIPLPIQSGGAISADATTADPLARVYQPEALDAPVLTARDGPIGSINPFDSAVRSPLYSPSEILRSTNPIIKAGAYALGDINLNKMRTNTRPGGTTGKFEMPSLKEDLYYLAGQTGPVGRAVQGAVQKPILRFDQGSPMPVRGKIQKKEGGRLQEATKPLGIFPQFIDEKALEKRRKDAKAKKKREAAKK